MAAFKRFEDIDGWKKAREFTNKIYTTSNKGEFSRDFDLRKQISV